MDEENVEPMKAVEKHTTSRTDSDAGFISHGGKHGAGYMLQSTGDCRHGIITGIDVYSANEKKSLHVLRHLERQQLKAGFQIQKLALDRGYDTGAVHRGLELLGIQGYIAPIQFSNTPQMQGLSYESEADCFICPKGQKLRYHRLYCNKSTGKYLRCYQIPMEACQACSMMESCLDKTSKRERVLAGSAGLISTSLRTWILRT